MWSEEPSTIRTEAKKLIQNRFEATKDLGVRLDGVEFKSLSISDNLSMLEGFSEEQIRDAVWQCEGSKSPEPDGFNFNFLKKSWEFLKEEFTTVMTLFHETGCIPKGCNASCSPRSIQTHILSRCHLQIYIQGVGLKDQEGSPHDY